MHGRKPVRIARRVDHAVDGFAGSGCQSGYGSDRDWNAYNLTSRQKLAGVIKNVRYDRESYAAISIEVDQKTVRIVLAPARLLQRGAAVSGGFRLRGSSARNRCSRRKTPSHASSAVVNGTAGG